MLIFDQPLKKLYNQTTHRIDLKRFLPIKSNFLQKQNSHQIFGYQIWSIQLYNLKIAGEKWKTLDKSTLNLPTRLWLMVLRLGLRTFKYCKTGIFSKKKSDFFTQILIWRCKRYVVMTITFIILDFLKEILYSLCNSFDLEKDLFSSNTY